jgi:hypothetical protein
MEKIVYPAGKIEDDKFVFGESVKKIRIDVGLSSSGPFSARWLKNNDDVGVIAIEANPYCCRDLIYGGTKNGMEDTLLLYYNQVSRYVGEVSEGYVGTHIMGYTPEEWINGAEIPFQEIPRIFSVGNSTFRIAPLFSQAPSAHSYDGYYTPTPHRQAPLFNDVKDITDRCVLLNAGVLNTKDPLTIEHHTLYSTFPRLGNSSFSKEFLDPCDDKEIKEEIKTPCLSLEKVFSYVDWSRFPVIECIKVDVEGVDLEVLKSAGNQIQKVVYFRVEAFDETSEHDAAINPEDGKKIIEYLSSKGFELFDRTPGDFKFVNSSLKHTIPASGYSWD